MENLTKLLIKCETLLRNVEENFWANKICLALEKAGSHLNTSMLDEILSWYGGMGSFNDLLVSRYNNHFVDETNEEKLNAELNRVRNQIYQEVLNIKLTMR